VPDFYKSLYNRTVRTYVQTATYPLRGIGYENFDDGQFAGRYKSKNIQLHLLSYLRFIDWSSSDETIIKIGSDILK
jgi:hypothetical protein